MREINATQPHMSFANIDQRRESQDNRPARKRENDAPHSQHIEVLDGGSHNHLLGPQQIGIFQRLNDAFQRYMLKLELHRRQPVATGCTNESRTMKSLKGKYGKIEKIIHCGSCITVRLHCRRAEDTKEKELYAVKVFHHCSQSNTDKSLRTELCITSNLKHPNIVRTVESLDDDRGELCMVMEYCNSGNLQSLIATSGKLGVLEADCFFKQLMRAISYIHDNDIAHRNLNPGDILLTGSGAVKVADFGDATWVHEMSQTQPTCPQEPLESISYQPPEAVSYCATDPRTGDIWAAALIYMTMRTGRHLWNIASEEDEEFERYLSTRKDEGGYPPIQRLRQVSISSFSLIVRLVLNFGQVYILRQFVATLFMRCCIQIQRIDSRQARSFVLNGLKRYLSATRGTLESNRIKNCQNNTQLEAGKTRKKGEG